MTDKIQRGDLIRWQTDDNPDGAGIAWGCPALTFKGPGGRWIVSVFTGAFAIPVGVEQITEVWREGTQVFPHAAQQLGLWAVAS